MSDTVHKITAKKSSPKSRPAKAKRPKVAPPHPKEVVGSEAAFQRYAEIAARIPDSEVGVYRLDPVLAYHNVQAGLTALMPHREELKRALPLLDHGAIFDLEALAQAVIFASTQVVGKTRSDGEIKALIGEASRLRSLLLSTADALVLSGIFKAQVIAKIRSGAGPIDLARDCVELASLYGKTPQSMLCQRIVRSEQLLRASELGTILLGRLRPSTARRKATDDKDKTAVDRRDRLATLLWQRHRDLRRAAYYLWGDELDAQVPPLQARAKVRPKKIPPVADPPSA